MRREELQSTVELLAMLGSTHELTNGETKKRTQNDVYYLNIFLVRIFVLQTLNASTLSKEVVSVIDVTFVSNVLAKDSQGYASEAYKHSAHHHIIFEIILHRKINWSRKTTENGHLINFATRFPKSFETKYDALRKRRQKSLTDRWKVTVSI